MCLLDFLFNSCEGILLLKPVSKCAIGFHSFNMSIESNSHGTFSQTNEGKNEQFQSKWNDAMGLNE